MSKKKQSENKFNVLLEELTSTLKETKGFVLEQAPDVAQQMVAEEVIKLKYDLTKCILLFIFSLVTAVTCYFYPDSREGAMVLRAVLGILGLLFVIGMSHDILSTMSEFAQLKAAPKVFLLYKLQRLMG